MRTSQKGLELIKKAEGVCLVIKPDNKGQQIGHGHDMQQREIISKMVYDVDVSNGISMIPIPKLRMGHQIQFRPAD